MKVYNVTDKKFLLYGQILQGYDFSEILENLKNHPIPQNGIVYQASVGAPESCEQKYKTGDLADYLFKSDMSEAKIMYLIALNIIKAANLTLHLMMLS